MPAYTLVISNPPHRIVDARRVAPLLGLIPIEVTLKANYTVPEIWLADTDDEGMRAAAAELTAAGVNAVVTTSDRFLAIPAQQLVREFELGPDRFVVHLSGAWVEIPYDVAALSVVSTPRPPEEGPGAVGTTNIAGVQISELSPFVDLYVMSGDGGARVTVHADVADFKGLGARKAPVKALNVMQLGQQLEKHLTNARHDRRLVNMQLRRKYRTSTPALKETRRGYSFASRGLTELLEAISPSQTDLSQAEFSSRLVYLTCNPDTRDGKG